MPEEKNLTQEELLWKIYKSTEKTRKYILWGRVMSLIYLLLIVVPLILAFIYLPPLVKNAIGPYQELLQGSSAQPSNLLQGLEKSGLDMEGIFKNLKSGEEAR